MRKFYFILFCLISQIGFGVGFAQEFSIWLYFEAANGEKDSLEIGYDPNATYGVDEEALRVIEPFPFVLIGKLFFCIPYISYIYKLATCTFLGI